MICTGCGIEVDDDAVACPECDTVLDASLLEMAAPDEASAPPKRTRPGSRSKPKVRRSSNERRTANSGMPEAPNSARSKAKNDWRAEVDPAEWGSKKVEAPQGPKFESTDPNDLMIDIKNFIASLSLADKLSFFGAMALFISSLLPWRETVAEGEVLGIFGAGLLACFVGILLMVSVAMRLRVPVTDRLVYWMVQLGLAGISVLWSLIIGIQSVDRTLARAPVGNFEVWTSKPSFGVVLAAFAGTVVIVGTVFGLKESSE